MKPFLLLPFLALLSACTPADEAPLDVSVIGDVPRLGDRGRYPLGPTAALLAEATAQGLVAFDAAGQTEPALAERWIVADDGLSFIFRLSDVDWADGDQVQAADVARRLRAAVAPGSRNPLLPITGAIAKVTAVTPEVIDVRLRSPRPNMLQLFAQPEFAMIRDGDGAGPLSATIKDGVATLRPRGQPAAETDPAAPPESQADVVRLRGERVGMAVARFIAGGADMVTGGTFADLAVARAAAPPRGTLRFDPAAGLFGLAFRPAPAGALTADPAMRRALAMVVDRSALVAAFAVPGWRAETRIVGSEVDDLPSVAEPDWAGLPNDQRRTAAAATVADWQAKHGTSPAAIAVLLPQGAGSRLLLARLTIDWRAIGVTVTRAARAANADLILIDAVAPGDISSWYLRRFACAMRVPCSPESETALTAARNAPTLPERTVLLREADRLIGETVPFIPLARPLRWSLVGPRVTGWRENARAFHPLRHLRSDRR